MADIVVFGAGAIADVATVYLQRHTDHRIVAYTADAAFCKANLFAGKPLVPWETLHDGFPPECVRLLGPLSFRRMNHFRRDRYLEGKARGYGFVTFVHPTCHVYTDDIGENCFILEQNVIQPFARIGNNVIMWSGNHIGHHSVIGDHCFLSSFVGISGSTRIGECCFFGGQSGVGAGVAIGNDCFFGEASVIVREQVPDGSVYLSSSTPRSKHDSLRLARVL
jgi:carbonic anhydrase/acetyltransferase-like protein (isoleucine patch superfamily)